MSEAEVHESLEAERDFLLRSLDDLDSELLAGNIDPDTYRGPARRLHGARLGRHPVDRRRSRAPRADRAAGAAPAARR